MSQAAHGLVARGIPDYCEARERLFSLGSEAVLGDDGADIVVAVDIAVGLTPAHSGPSRGAQ